MTRTNENPVYENAKSVAMEPHYDPNSLLQYSNQNGINRDGSLNVVMTNRETQRKEQGNLFVPNISDSKRIYNFLKTSLPTDKALEYSQNEIDYLIGLKSSILSCVTNPEGRIVGITIAYPAPYLPKAAEAEKWVQEGGFSEKMFNNNAIYSELRALSNEYRGNGLGDILRSNQILEVVKRGYNQIVLYSVPGAYKNNISYGFEDKGLVKLLFDGGKTSDTHLMKLDINKKVLDQSNDILKKYLI